MSFLILHNFLQSVRRNHGRMDDRASSINAFSDTDEAPEGYEWGPEGILMKINDGKTCCCNGGFRGDCAVHGFKK